jgi:hypothetical protein
MAASSVGSRRVIVNRPTYQRLLARSSRERFFNIISAGERGVVAEASGFTHAWLADSQMVWADCLSMPGLVNAQQDQARHECHQPELSHRSRDRLQLRHPKRACASRLIIGIGI